MVEEERADLLDEGILQPLKIAPEVSRTVYSNGSEIIANYSKDDFVYEGRTVGSLSYVVVE